MVGSENNGFAGRKALVTGAAGGIGSSIVERADATGSQRCRGGS